MLAAERVPHLGGDPQPVTAPGSQQLDPRTAENQADQTPVAMALLRGEAASQRASKRAKRDSSADDESQKEHTAPPV